MDTNRTRVVLADDDVLLREGLASLLDRSGLEVVGQADDAAELLELVGRLRPELAVVDIRMPPKHSTEGLDAARVIQQDCPETERWHWSGTMGDRGHRGKARAQHHDEAPAA